MKGDQIHDYSVCTTWLPKAEGNHYLTDLVRQRCEYPALIQLKSRRQYRRHRPDSILIEDKGTGTSLIQDLRYNDQLSPIAIKPEGDKETRLSTASLTIEQGKVWFPKNAPWLGSYDELPKINAARCRQIPVRPASGCGPGTLA